MRLTGVAAAKLRFWENKYRLIQPRRDPIGRRLYSKRDLQRIKRIQQLLDEGLNLIVVSEMLEAEERNEAQHVV
ncbi:MAG: MerR family transcriptional regulator [Armatimonadota bacterium]|nr:MAG: MerR family transcriptional regulator [Armatimonadota bacterium]